MVANNAGQPATPADLINVDEVIGKYYDLVPDPSVPEQRVIFGTSGHRGSSLKTSFNEAHIVAISQAIAEYRKKAGVTGPLYLGSDTHALSGPAKKTAIEVLVANGVHVRIDSRDDFVPTPVVSQAILTHNRAADGTQRFEGEGLADGIVVTPSHNPPTDGGFKYDPVTGGPAPAETTNAIAARANELLADYKNVKRVPYEEAIKSEYVEGFDFREHWGVMNPNHYIAVCVEYLFGGNRPGWPEGAAVGKTLVSSSLIDRVAASINAKVLEVPVGFKWFVDPLFSGEVAFGGEESSGMSFLRKNGRVWTTDKDGLIPDLLAAEITAKTGKNPAQLHQEQVERFGESWYKRVDTPTTLEQKAKFAALSGDDVTASTLAGEDITAKLTEAPGNHAKIGGLKVTTKDNWFAARPSGTENIYKVYAESFVSPEALDKVLDEATEVVDKALGE